MTVSALRMTTSKRHMTGPAWLGLSLFSPHPLYRSGKPEAPPGACNHSPGSRLLSITTQLHYGGHIGGRARLPDTLVEEDHPMTIPSKFDSN